MIALINTIFGPVLNWLFSIREYISQLSTPIGRPIMISDYLGPFALLGPWWMLFISTACGLAFIYVLTFLIIASQGTFVKFKDTIKWW